MKNAETTVKDREILRKSRRIRLADLYDLAPSLTTLAKALSCVAADFGAHDIGRSAWHSDHRSGNSNLQNCLLSARNKGFSVIRNDFAVIPLGE